MLQKFHYARIVEILFSNVISNLDAQVTVAYATVKLSTSEVNVLQWNLAKRFQPAFGTLAHLQRNVIEQARAIQGVLCFAGVGK
jgi:hypothetical protein